MSHRRPGGRRATPRPLPGADRTKRPAPPRPEDPALGERIGSAIVEAAVTRAGTPLVKIVLPSPEGALNVDEAKALGALLIEQAVQAEQEAALLAVLREDDAGEPGLDDGTIGGLILRVRQALDERRR